jgi:hypothetical protein
MQPDSKKSCDHIRSVSSHNQFPYCARCKQLIGGTGVDQLFLRRIRAGLERDQQPYVIAYDIGMTDETLQINLDRLGYTVETRPVLRKRKPVEELQK